MKATWGRKGFQLAELLLSVFIFSFVGGLCFLAAASGFRVFNHTSGRQALQRDARAIFTWLQRDVGLSNLLRCERVERITGSDRRDSLAVAAMNSWQQPLRVDSLGLPEWNRVVVYHTTSSATPGRLVRQVYIPSSSDIPLQFQTVSQLLTQVVTETAGAVAPADQRRLSGSIRSFSISKLESSNKLDFSLTLQESTVDAGGGQPRLETLQVETTIYPRNTWPRL